MSHDIQPDIKELLVNLINTINNRNAVNENPAPARRNTMSACRVRFSGQYDQEAVENFLTTIENFKAQEAIEDEEALRDVSLLLTGFASSWWQGVKRETETWQDFVRLLREQFAPRKEPYQIYMEIFNTKQDAQMTINEFIVEKRALLAQLPQGYHNEECQIDLLYGLIHYKYRQFIKRSEIHTFQELLQKARSFEQSHVEAINEDKAAKTKRCSHCNYRGHTTEECRRKQQKQHQQQSGESPNKL